MLAYGCGQFLFIAGLPSHLQIEQKVGRHGLLERFQHSFGHEEVECRNGLSSVLLVLVGLEDNGRQCGIALYGLWGTDAAVFCVEPPLEQVVQIILYAGGRFGRIVVEVVDMDVPVPVRLRVLWWQQVLVGVVLGDFRGKRHHLSCRRVARHVGVAQVHVVLVDGDNPVHDMLDLRLAFALDVSPLPVDDVFLGHFRLGFHQFRFHQILDFLHSDGRLRDACRHFPGYCPDLAVPVLYAGGPERFSDGVADLVCRKVLPLSVTFDDADVRLVHCLQGLKVKK